METANLKKLVIDQTYLKAELDEMQLTQINNHRMDYYIYQGDGRVYFFEKIDDNLYRLYCVTSKDSFYL